MKKIRLVILTIVSVCFLSGCAIPLNNNGNGLFVQPEQRTEDNGAVIDVNYLDRVTFIEVVDTRTGIYKESLYIELTPEEVEALKDIKGALELSYKSWEGFGSFDYKLNMYDADGNLITYWNVPTSYYVMDGEGQCIDENDELKAWIDSIQDSHNIYTEIYNRTPGENYFTDLATVKKGNAFESVDYYEGLEYIHFDLDEEDIEAFRAVADDMCVIEELKMSEDELHESHGDLYYRLDVYTEIGDGYYFGVTYDGTIFVHPKSVFVVTGEGVEEWFRTLEAKYGLDQIEN